MQDAVFTCAGNARPKIFVHREELVDGMTGGYRKLSSQDANIVLRSPGGLQ